MHKRIILALLLMLFSASLVAQIPSGYYNSAEGKTGTELKAALHNIIKDHHVVSYSGLLDAYAYTDCYPDGKIWDIYSNKHWSLSGTCGSYDGEGDCWNREHTWPQSWFDGKSTPKSDLFHVMPTDGYVNNRRSNYPYGEVNNPKYTSGNGSKLGPCVTSGYTGTVFEPVDEYKGDIARNFFYMSVRYYGEDSGWKTSEMTNKSEIKSWALAMLLRWSDEDPVSQKEIDRNNAIYGFQNNRNPFIDHPEYAKMIWDPNWEAPTTTYTITCASTTNGSISAPANAAEGITVAIDATPDPGYMVTGYSAYKTGSPSTTITVSSNGTFTMPAFAVTVSATFEVNNTYYTITAGDVTHGTISVPTSAKSGTTVTMTATPDSGYSLYSWYVYKTDDINTNVYSGPNGSFTMPAFNVTVTATFFNQSSSSNGDFVKVTETPNNWSGDYLIVYEEGNVAFNGGQSNLDATNNTITVTINNNTIAANSTTIAAKFTIAPMTDGYSIKAANGKYIGQGSNSNGLTVSDTPLKNTITLNSDADTDIIGSGNAHLRYNASSDQLRFRYFKSSTYTSQKAIQLYKRTVTVSHTIHFYPNGGAGSMNDQNVDEYIPTALNSNTFTRQGFEFDGWNTQADGTGTYYADNASVTLTDDLNLYAQWNQKYSITLAEVANGTISATPTSAVEEATITLTATPDEGYDFNAWTVTTQGGVNIEVYDDQFEMPADNVTVSATFVVQSGGGPFTQNYYRVTSTDMLVAGRSYLIVCANKSQALSKTQNNNNRSAASVTIDGDTIKDIGQACELTLGGSTGAWTFFDANYQTSGGYLYAASSSSNSLKTQVENNANGQWTINLDGNGLSTIVANGNNTRNHLRYNNGSNLFSCYASGASTTDMPLVTLYIRSESYTIAQNTTVANMFYFDKYTVENGATLTVTNTANHTNPNLLILEDGAEFVHHNDGVQATVIKNIAAYSEAETSDGWYTLALPMASINPNHVNGMTQANYDLYHYDENADLEWINHKNSNFNMNAGTGYLYAHNPHVNLEVKGTLNNGNTTQTVDLSFANTQESIKGFNLLGNPTTHSIHYSKTDSVSDGYYYMANHDNWVYTTNETVPAGRGFLVKANASGQQVTLNSNSKRGTEAGQYLHIQIDEEEAYIKLTEGVSMPLFNLNGQHSKLFLSKDNTNYVMLVRDKEDALILNYEPNRKGQHTLSIDFEKGQLEYLHLIDYLTGTDIDLMVQPTYQFESNMNDFTSRFKLVFSPFIPLFQFAMDPVNLRP